MQLSLVISSILLQILAADTSGGQEDLISSAAADTSKLGVDKETVLCRSCGRGLADPHYLHTSQLSPEFLARFVARPYVFQPFLQHRRNRHVRIQL